jgi:hypothetical protein
LFAPSICYSQVRACFLSCHVTPSSSTVGCNAHAEPSYTSVCVAAPGCQGGMWQNPYPLTLPHPHGSNLLDIATVHPRCPVYPRVDWTAGLPLRPRGALPMPLCARGASNVRAGHIFTLVSFVPASLHYSAGNKYTSQLRPATILLPEALPLPKDHMKHLLDSESAVPISR